MNTSITKSGRVFLFLATAGILSLTACKKDKLPEIPPASLSTVGVYVLNEGTYSATTGGSASSISYYDVVSQKVEIDYFKKQNNKALGDNANDLKQYGSKIYCVITGTTQSAKDSYLEVISESTGKSLKRIAFSDENGGFMPRNIVFDKNKAYISGYDGKITRLDTASLTIDSRLLVGGALEQLAIAKNKIYVTNSVHPSFPSPISSSVSVVDIATFTKLKEIPTALNPRAISAAPSGDLFVQTSGQYPTIPGTIDRLSSTSDTRISTGSDLGLSFLSITGTTGFAIGYASTAPYAAAVKFFDTNTGTLGADLVKDATVIKGPYGVTLDPFEKTFYIADAKTFTGNGTMFCFGADGKTKFSFETGIAPKLAAFKYGY
ncbi:hypothetical protein QG516_05570 [Pedobacter gandavensis]|uniref:YncE family protein n=1 Tax=Pedobacter TaxID=84567 RepID=UPI001C999CF9|nr:MULTISPECIES: DUF5074 domain-containing protein [Pedobacter]WGQ11124.1 hypothetical protein QG516_05570 [Pedobacter gandavensis]